MLSQKRPGRYPRYGTIYFWCLAGIFLTSTSLAAVRWAEDYHLFILGALSFAAAFLGRQARRRRWRYWIRLHITGMGASYVLLLIAFYVDNGKQLPIWQKLPHFTFGCCPWPSAFCSSLALCCGIHWHDERARLTKGSGGLAAASALAVLLDRRAGHGAVRAKHAAVARQRLQPSAAALAVIEELAGVRWHRFNGLVSADRTSQCRLKLHRGVITQARPLLKIN